MAIVEAGKPVSASVHDRIPPSDIEIERLIIGCLILDPTLAEVAITRITGADFYDDQLGRVYDVLVSLWEMGKPIGDIRYVTGELKRFSVIGENGIGVGELVKCVTETPNAGHINYYVEILIEHSRHRALIELSTKMMKRLWEKKPDLTSICTWAVNQLSDVETRSAIEITPMSESMRKAKTRIAEKLSQGSGTGVSSGFEKLDRITGGFVGGEVTILAARPGGGKTAMATQLAMQIVESGHSVLFVSLEMGDHEIAERQMLAMAGVDSNTVRRGRLESSKLDDFDRAIERVTGLPFYFYAPPSGATVRHISAAIRVAEMTMQKKIGLVVIDYIEKVTADNSREPRHEQLAKISNGIKQDIAKEFDIPVLLLSQLNRDSQGKKPTMADLKGSGNIEQDAASIIAIHKPEDERFRELLVVKSRSSDTGTVVLEWDGRRTRYREQDDTYVAAEEIENGSEWGGS
jgi:replicative DNA helicase